MIRSVFIKDFQYYANRRILNTENSVWNLNLFSVEYEAWKHYRSITTAAFSSGKLRNMNPLIKNCIEKFFGKIDSFTDGIFIPKEVFTNFSIDITASTFFATETNAQQEQNPIVKQCLALVDIPALRSAAVGILPRPLLKALGISSVFREEPLEYICDLLRSIVKQQRELPSERQNDFIRLLVESKEEEVNGNKGKVFKIIFFIFYK